MRRLEVEPFDVVLFRDARPFGVASAAGHAGSVFPPPPSAVYGAIRTAAFRAHGALLRTGGAPEVPPSVAKAWGDATTHGSARIFGPVAWKGGPLWTMPRTLLREKGTPQTGRCTLATPAQRTEGMASSLVAPWKAITCAEPGVFVPADGYLDSDGLAAFLKGVPPSTASCHPEDAFALREERTGIAREASTATVSRGALFTMGFRRFVPGAALAAWISGDSDAPLPPRGLLRLGHDGRLARYTTGEASRDWPTLPEIRGSRVLAYLATPCLFAKGWLPSWIDDKDGRVAGFGARLVAASTTPLVLGGWDLARRAPRALRHYVSAGAVYFFEADGVADAKALATRLHGASISEGVAEAGTASEGADQMGFGLCLAGVW